MSRTARVRTVTRIRELQERIAESAAAQRAHEAAARRADVDRSIQALAERDEGDRRPSFQTFARRQTELDGALIELNHRVEVHEVAQRDAEAAQQELHTAHQRHEAIERLLERVEAEESDELVRLEQAELDELATIRRSAATPHDHQEDT